MVKILIINGPNLQLLGTREPEIYGKLTLRQINEGLEKFASALKGVELEFLQSNHEGAIIDKIGNSKKEGFAGIVINPAAFTHTSFAIYDALKAVDIPCVEVHLSNIYKREEFRRNSVTAASCLGVISGMGEKGYEYAVTFLTDYIKK